MTTLRMADPSRFPATHILPASSQKQNNQYPSGPYPDWPIARPPREHNINYGEPAFAIASESVDPNSRPKYFGSLFEELIYIFTVMMASSAATFLQGIVVINTSTIGSDLSMNTAEITWIAASITLSSGSFMLFFGKTADLFGRKIQLLAGMVCLSLVSLIASFAPSPIALDVLCGFLGLGTAVISPPAIGTLLSTYPEGRRKNKAVGMLGTGNPVGFRIGSISAGLVTKYFNWRASFIVASIFYFMMALLALWTMPTMPRDGHVRTEFKRFDWLGTILTVAGMTLLCAALTEGPTKGWKSASVLATLIIGIILLISFALWENHYLYPLLDPSVWRDRNYSISVLCVFFGYMSFFTNNFWICLYMQEVQGMSPLTIAIRLLPQAFIGFLWSYIGQALVHRVSGTIIMGIGAAAYLIGAVLLLFMKPETSYWIFLFPSMLITVIGADFQFIVANLYIGKQMESQASLAAGVLQTATRISVSIGLSISAAVYGSGAATSGNMSIVHLAYRRAFLCSVAFAALGLLLVPFLRISKQGGAAALSPEMPPEEETKYEYRDNSNQTEPIEHGRKYVERGNQTETKETGNDSSSGSSTQVSNTPPRRHSTIGFMPAQSWENAASQRSREGLQTDSERAGGSQSSTILIPRWSWQTVVEKDLEASQRIAERNDDGSSVEAASAMVDLLKAENCDKCFQERRLLAGGFCKMGPVRDSWENGGNTVVHLNHIHDVSGSLKESLEKVECRMIRHSRQFDTRKSRRSSGTFKGTMLHDLTEVVFVEGKENLSSVHRNVEKANSAPEFYDISLGNTTSATYGSNTRDVYSWGGWM